MRYKIIMSLLVLAFAISLGFSFHSYSTMVGKQKMINNIRSEMILAWATEMDIAGYYLKKATANVDIAHGIEKQTYGARAREFIDAELGITWIDHPAILELKNKPDIELDWEHTEYRWIKPEELKNFDTVPQLERTLENALV